MAVDILAIVVYAVCSFFIVRYDAVAGVMTDGFGRAIIEPPIFFKLYLHIGEWVGLGWWIVDTVGFLVAISVAYVLYEGITEKKNK